MNKLNILQEREATKKRKRYPLTAKIPLLLMLFLFACIPLISGCDNDDDKLEEVKEPNEEDLPKSMFSYECGLCIANESIYFKNKSENAEKYLWSFGDGVTTDESDPVHTYVTHGTYKVRLDALNTFNDEDYSNRYEKTITIGKECIRFTPRNCPDKASCLDCLHDDCCDEIIACLNDEKCIECFKTGNYTPCAGNSATTELVVCSASNCSDCNGCY